MIFEMIGKIREIETFAIGTSIREIKRLQKRFGAGRWRKRKGFTTVRLSNGTTHEAELHWYEAHGIGKKELKIKHLLD